MSIRMHKNQKSSDSQPVIKGVNNIDELRKPYELSHHWALRKEFIQIYSDKFDLDRLICLSNVFINVECMGLTYPDEVMKLIKELGSKVKGLETYKYQLERDEPELPRKHSSHNNHNHHNHHHHSNNNWRQRY